MRKPVNVICQQQRRSAFVVHCLDSIIPILAKSKISKLYLVSVAEQGGLSLNYSQTLNTGFHVTWLIYDCQSCFQTVLFDFYDAGSLSCMIVTRQQVNTNIWQSVLKRKKQYLCCATVSVCVVELHLWHFSTVQCDCQSCSPILVFVMTLLSKISQRQILPHLGSKI